MDSLLREILASRVYEVVKRDGAGRRAAPVAAPRQPRAVEARGHAADLQLQDPRRLQPDCAADRDGTRRGVIAASAGNHAQGVAFSARRLGIRAVIVMPRTTPEIKVDAVKALGAEVVLVGDRYAEAQQHASSWRRDRPRLRPPVRRSAGHRGTGDRGGGAAASGPGDLSAVFVPVGGGGLIAGIASYIKALRPDIHVFGVEPFDADAMACSLEAGRRVRLDDVGIFVDGVAVQQVGAHTFPIAQATVDGDHPRQQRRGVRGDQGHLRRHPHDRRAGRRAGAGGVEVVRGPRAACADGSWPRC